MQSSKELGNSLQSELHCLKEQLATIKMLVLGDADASFPEAFQAIAKLKDKANKHVINEKVELLYSLIGQLPRPEGWSL